MDHIKWQICNGTLSTSKINKTYVFNKQACFFTTAPSSTMAFLILAPEIFVDYLLYHKLISIYGQHRIVVKSNLRELRHQHRLQREVQSQPLDRLQLLGEYRHCHKGCRQLKDLLDDIYYTDLYSVTRLKFLKAECFFEGQIWLLRSFITLNAIVASV